MLVLTYFVPAPTQVLELPVSTMRLSIKYRVERTSSGVKRIQKLTLGSRTANANGSNVRDGLVVNLGADRSVLETSNLGGALLLKVLCTSLVVFDEVLDAGSVDTTREGQGNRGSVDQQRVGGDRESQKESGQEGLGEHGSK